MSAVFPIEDDPRYRRYTASAGQTVFPIPFPFQQNDDMKVFLQTAPSLYTEINKANYTLAGAGNPAGGSVTLAVGRAAGDVILIIGEAVIDRLTSIVTGGRFRSDLTDDELDRNRIILLELFRETDRSLKVDYGATGYTIANDLVNGQFLMVDGQRIVGGATGDEIANAQGYAELAAEHAYDASLAQGAANASAGAAATSATLAGKWANNAEDVEVIGGSGLFSAFHWYRKTLAIWTAFVTTFAGAIHAATAKLVFADTDELGIADSAAAWALKKVTWLAVRLGVFVHAAVAVASAATCDIGSAASFFVSITGTTAITSLGSAAGIQVGTLRLVQFTGALTLTNNANIITPTAASITTSANAFALCRYEGAGVWRIVWYRGTLSTADWTTGTKAEPGTPTPAQIAAAIAAIPNGLGVGQTWQDVTASRAMTTVYQNTSGKPIAVNISGGGTATTLGTVDVSPDNVTWQAVGYGVFDTSGAHRLGASFVIVPNGHYYRYTPGSGGVLSKWMELR